MPKRRKSRKSSARRTRVSTKASNSCCPVIYVKCARPAGTGKVAGLGSVTFPFERQGVIKSAQASAMAFERGGATSYERKDAVRKKRIMCTVRAGRTRKRVNVVDVKKTVAAMVGAQQKRRCVPGIKRG